MSIQFRGSGVQSSRKELTRLPHLGGMRPASRHTSSPCREMYMWGSKVGLGYAPQTHFLSRRIHFADDREKLSSVEDHERLHSAQEPAMSRTRPRFAYKPLKVALLSWRFRVEITSKGISLGQTAEHSPMFVQPPKPSSSIWFSMFTTRLRFSGCPCGSRPR